MSKRAVKKAKIEAAKSVRVSLEVTDDISTHFVNYAEVNFNAYEITISALRIPARLSAARLREGVDGGVVVVNGEVQLVLPPNVAVELAKALKTQTDNYVSQFGPLTPSGAPDE